MNFFAYKSAAERYAKHRPYFHPLVIEKIRSRLNLQEPVDLAFDIGCGPGQSTVALKEIAVSVVGLDISAQMLDLAKNEAGISYLRSAAERLAIRSRTANLLTTSMAYHWFEPDRFFTEANRVLKERGWLVIFNHWFMGQMNEDPDFEVWTRDVYHDRFPIPPRNSTVMSTDFAQSYGFDFVFHEQYQNELPFTAHGLAGYLTTQSNVIAATEQGSENVEEVYEWLVAQVRRFFRNETATFRFSGFIWYLQKAA